MYDYLFKKQGFERLIEIDNLNRFDHDFICSFYRSCGRCPLGVLHRDTLDIERVLCVDVSSRRTIEAALKQGGHFINKGEFKK